MFPTASFSHATLADCAQLCQAQVLIKISELAHVIQALLHLNRYIQT